MFSFLNDEMYLCSAFIGVTAITVIYQYSKRQRKAGLRYHAIHVISNAEEWNAIENDFSASVARSKVIGLDCEWTTEGKVRQPVALLQMATDNICVLFRLCLFNTSFPPVLTKLLADEKILKVGVDIWGDRSKLLQDHQIVVNGCLDLRHLVVHIPEAAPIRKFGLSGMASSILKYELCKERKIRCSNWQQDILSKKQINYGAQDAVVALQIFKAIMKSTLSYFASLFLTVSSEVELLYKQALLICSAEIDVPYKSGNSSRKVECSKAKETNKYLTTRAKPLYDNCRLQAPDGEILCVCDTKKAQWYLDKKLGEIVEDDPLTVRLNFEPSGRPRSDDIYYIHHKENCCVVCGKAESYIKKKIVPHEYRRYFPDLMKSHLSHDVLLLCVHCHKKSSGYDLVLRQTLAEECDAPLASSENNKILHDPVISKIYSAARALTLKREKIPEARIEELEKRLKDYYDIEEVTSEVLQEVLNLEYRTVNENYSSHGLKVVQYKSRTVGLPSFEAQWRQHFLDTMKPQYLPKMWSVNHNHKRLLLQIKTKNLDFDVSVLGEMNGITQEPGS